MKNLRFLFGFIFCAGLFCGAVKSQTDIQYKFDALIPRQTNLERIEKLLGKPESQILLKEWSGNLRSDGAFRGYSYENTPCRYDVTYGFVKRNLYSLSYPESGLKIQIFDRPSKLYSIETTNPNVFVSGIKIGDTPEKVRAALGRGQWQTFDGSSEWRLAYEKKGVVFIFPRDLSVKQYPMKLAQESTVIRMEIFDRETSFSGCSKRDW